MISIKHNLIFTGLTLACLSAPISLFADPAPVTATQVNVFQPTLPVTGKAQQGYCWTQSVAIPRTNAWRCMIDSAIQDPCFSTSDPNKVVCGVSPITHQKGFVIQLTKPLPAQTATSPQAANSAWVVQLEDGSVCRPYTGTLRIVNGSPVKYFCSDSGKCMPNVGCQHMTGLLDSLTPGKIWTAQKATYSTSPTGGITLEKVTQVNIATVWQ